jgi:hypothetical protein
MSNIAIGGEKMNGMEWYNKGDWQDKNIVKDSSGTAHENRLYWS